ncbi:MAG: leucine-rich repeat protein [Cytophagales bacterium]|nr:leucine-rich repeat protein [Cytophagales bacterium]
MNKILKLFCLLLFLSICSRVQAQHILTDEEVVVTNGTLVECSYLGPDIIIPPYLDGQEVTRIGSFVFSVNQLMSVVLPSGLTEIMWCAFSDNHLSKVELPSKLTSIGPRAFENNQLTSIKLPDKLTSIGSQAFENNQLTSIKLPDKLISIGSEAFKNNRLANVKLPNEISFIGENAFAGNLLTRLSLPTHPKLKGIWLSGNSAYHEGAKVPIDKSYLFKPDATYTLTDKDVEVINGELVKASYPKIYVSIAIPNTLDGQKVTRITTKLFYEKQLTDVKLPDSLSSIGAWAFSRNRLTSINLPKNLTRIEKGAFCLNQLSSAVFPERLAFIERDAFSDNQLTSIKFPNSLSAIGMSAFSNNQLSSVKLPNSLTVIKAYAFSSNQLKNIKLPDDLTSIGERAFYHNQLTNVELPNGLTNIGSSAFYVNQLSKINLPFHPSHNGKWHSRKAIYSEGSEASVDSAYHYNVDRVYTLSDKDVKVENGEIIYTSYPTIYSNIIIPNTLDGQKITRIGEKVFQKKYLESIKLPRSLTSIGKEAFSNNWLTNIELPDSLTNIGDEAFSYNQLTNIKLPGSLTVIGTLAFKANQLTDVKFASGLTKIGAWAFSQNQLTNIELPDGLVMIGRGAFFNNQLISAELPGSLIAIEGQAFAENKLTSVKLPSRLTFIGYNAFSQNQLTSIKLPNSIARIGSAAFSNNKLSSVKLPDSLISIGWEAFSHNKLANVKLPNSLASIGAEAFKGNKLLSVQLPGKLIRIYREAFSDNQLTSVKLPDGLGLIGEKAFYNNQLASVELPNGLYLLDKNAFAKNQLTGFRLPTLPAQTGGEYIHWEDSNHSVHQENETVTDLEKAYRAVFNSRGVLVSGLIEGTKDVTIKISGDLVKEMKASRNFAFLAEKGKSVTVTPVKKGVIFSPNSINLNDLQKNAQQVFAGSLANYSIAYHNAKGDNPNPANYTVESETITLQSLSAEGYVFQGWYRDADYAQSVSEITKGTAGDLELYAKWEPKSYAITYRGIKDTNPNPANYTVESETFALQNLSAKGYTFQGWYRDAAFTQAVTEIAKGTSGDLELYAKWEKADYKITYHNEKNYNPNQAGYSENSETIALQNLSAEGYIFRGWYKDEVFSQAVTEISKGTTGDLNLYAKWELKGYVISYRGTKGTNPNPANYTVESETIVLQNLSAGGFIFRGWYRDAAFSQAATEIAKGTTGDLELYAKWEKADYAIIYHNVKGYNPNQAGYSEDSETFILQNLDVKGYAFRGWYRDAACTQAVTEIAKGTTGNLELYAEWELRSYSIAYRGIKGDNPNPANYTFESETIALQNLSADGYVFQGWYRDAVFTQEVTEIAKGTAGDLELYAKWASVLEAEKPEQNVQVSPNPFVRILNLKNAGKGSRLQIITLGGQVLKETVLPADSYQLDCSDFSKGLYLLRINGRTVQKIIKR